MLINENVKDEDLYKQGIYEIRNIKNNKRYIGKTMRKKGILDRWKQHIADLKYEKHSNKYLQRSWNKYGEENFEFNILEVINDEDENFINEREQYWIKYYETYENKDKGYNLTKGGDGSLGIIVSEETRQKLRDMFKNMDKDKRELMLKRRSRSISIAQKGRKFSEETKEKMSKARLGKKLPMSTIEKMRLNSTVKVVQLDLQGNFIREWNSMRLAERESNGEFNCDGISSCCLGKSKSHRNYFWFYSEVYYTEDFDINDHISNIQRKRFRDELVYQYDNKGKLVSYGLLQDYREQGFNIYKILECIEKERRSCGGFLWGYEDTDITDKIKPKTTSKSVVQYSLDGDILNIFDSATEAGLKTGISFKYISACCTGKIKKTGGYVWKFKSESYEEVAI